MHRLWKLIPAVMMLANAGAGAQSGNGPLPYAGQVVDSLSRLLGRSYVYPLKAAELSDFLKDQLRAGSFADAGSADGLAARLTAGMRAKVKDDHLRVVYDPELEADIRKFLGSKAGAARVSEKEVEADQKRNFHVRKLEILPGNIGYLDLRGFSTPGPSSRRTVQAAMRFLMHTDALIIDLRQNFGGNGAMAAEIAGYFFEKRVPTGRSFNRLEDKWSEEYLENQGSVTGGLSLRMPLYILTSSQTYSAAEGLAYTLQSLGRARIVGDTTRGGAHLTRSFAAGNGFVAFIPYQRGENLVTRTDWEGAGVRPDIVVQHGNAIVVAQSSILGSRLNASADTPERNRIQYLINSINAADGPLPPAVAGETLTGRFAEFEVTLRANKLLFRDTNQPEISYKPMLPVSDLLFQVGGDYQVRFLVENGACGAIRMYWEDGYTEVIQRK